jgi:hypothetical protein
MTRQVDPSDRLWTRELRPAEDVEDLIMNLVVGIANTVAAEMEDNAVNAPGEVADLICDGKRGAVHEVAVRIVERLREVYDR